VKDRAIAGAQLARTLWVQGFLDQAVVSVEEIQRANHFMSYCPVLYFGLCRVALMRGNPELAEPANDPFEAMQSQWESMTSLTIGIDCENRETRNQLSGQF
jgi:hypothetical protein